MPAAIRIGDVLVHVLSDGHFRLDGGAMFGVVPKPAWNARLPADELNRVRLGLNCLLVRPPSGRVILVDTGLGDRWTEQERSGLGLERPAGGGLVAELAAVGLSPARVEVVASSHLHFDHAGGNVATGADGALHPVFPEARHVVQAVEWDDAGHPHERNRASYRAEDFLPLEESGQLELVEGRVELDEGITLERTPGHCPGMQVLTVESRNEGLVFPADLMPTAAHVRPAWNMGYDLDVTATVAAKRDLLERVMTKDWIVCFDHDPATPLVRLRREEAPGNRTRVVTEPVRAEVAS